MATFEITKDNLEQSIKDNSMLLVDFWGDRCMPCTQFGPIFEKVSDDHPDIGFAKCHTNTNPEVAAVFGIKSIPTLGVFKDQALVYLEAGALPQQALEDLIAKVRELDMNEVKAEMERQQEGGMAPGAIQEAPPPSPSAPPQAAPAQAAPAQAAPPPVAAAPSEAKVEVSLSSGETMAQMADDHILRRQGVTREFLEQVAEGKVPDIAKQVLGLYQQIRDLLKEKGHTEGRPEGKALFEKNPVDKDAMAALDADLRGEIKAVLWGIEELLKN